MSEWLTLALCIAQGGALVLLAARLAPGRTRRPPVQPIPDGVDGTSVSVLVPSYNEAKRIGPCLEGLSRQGKPVREILVIDSRSTDGTDTLVSDASVRDPRIRLLNDPPLPPGWVGKVWALQHGLHEATGDWVLGVDADTAPVPGMVAGVIDAAQRGHYDVVSFAPRFAGMTATEQWLQPSMLLTLVYRFGAAGAKDPPPDRVMANGQCFLARREVLVAHGGYEAARASWADDVSLARHLAASGLKVGFLDGSRLYDVRAYESLGHMWREWGRSFDLSDATTRARQWFDVLFVVLVQGLPLPLLIVLGVAGVPATTGGRVLLWLNVALVSIRALMTLALVGSYARRTPGFWLSLTSDPVAAVRLILSSLKRPRQWRGRAFTPAR